jgi:GDP-D-mannose dehydratase
VLIDNLIHSAQDLNTRYRALAGLSKIRIDPRYFRPTEVETLLDDPTKAKQKIGWVPEITAQEMCAEMVTYGLADAKKMPCSSSMATTSP